MQGRRAKISLILILFITGCGIFVGNPKKPKDGGTVSGPVLISEATAESIAGTQLYIDEGVTAPQGISLVPGEELNGGSNGTFLGLPEGTISLTGSVLIEGPMIDEETVKALQLRIPLKVDATSFDPKLLVVAYKIQNEDGSGKVGYVDSSFYSVVENKVEVRLHGGIGTYQALLLPTPSDTTTKEVEYDSDTNPAPTLELIPSQFLKRTFGNGFYGRSIGVDDEIFFNVTSTGTSLECKYPGTTVWTECKPDQQGKLSLKDYGKGGGFSIRTSFDGVNYSTLTRVMHEFQSVSCSHTVKKSDVLDFNTLTTLSTNKPVICFEDGTTITNTTQPAINVKGNSIFIARVGHIVKITNLRLDGTNYNERGIFIADTAINSMAVIGLSLETKGGLGYTAYCNWIDSCFVDDSTITVGSSSSGIYIRGNNDQTNIHIKGNTIKSLFHGIESFAGEGGYWEVVGNTIDAANNAIEISGAEGHRPSVISYNTVTNSNVGFQLYYLKNMLIEQNNIVARSRSMLINGSSYPGQLETVTIRRNTVHTTDASGSGLSVLVGDDATGNIDKFFIHENTVRANDSTGIIILGGALDSELIGNQFIKLGSGNSGIYAVNAQGIENIKSSGNTVCYAAGATEWSAGTSGPGLSTDNANLADSWVVPKQKQISGACTIK